MARNSDMKKLHPVFRKKIEKLTKMLKTEDLPFRLFEGYRTPQRQANLYAKGRTRSGSIVTKARPWSSYHQYGVAADFVLYMDGKWSWNDSGDYASWWQRLHELARQVGLEPISWEKPHLQMQDISLASLKAGQYPEDGDDNWADNLADAIESWSGDFEPPPLPSDVPERPAIVEFDEKGEVQAAKPRYRVIARRGLRVREGAGKEYDIVDVLSLNQRVSVMETHGDWYLIDIEGDGIADGFCYSSYLVPEN